MINIISKEALSSKFTLENLETWGLAAVTTVGGMLVSHVALKAIKKQDNWIATGCTTVAGIAGAIFIKNGWLKLFSLGVAGYGLIRTANIAVKEATEPGTTQGLAGLIPETIKAKIRSFLPTLGSTSETLLGDDDLSGMPNLDDIAGVEDVGYVDVTDQKGIGATML